MSIPSSEYNRYLAAIKAANDSQDKEALRQIQKQLIAQYGPNDSDADRLLAQMEAAYRAKDVKALLRIRRWLTACRGPSPEELDRQIRKTRFGA